MIAAHLPPTISRRDDTNLFFGPIADVLAHVLGRREADEALFPQLTTAAGGLHAAKEQLTVKRKAFTDTKREDGSQ
jgi:hypothetical protein